MKKIIYSLLSVAILASCSAPKYTASFPNYDKSYSASTSAKVIASQKVEVDPQELVASTSTAPVEIAAVTTATAAPVKREFNSLTRVEKKEVKAQIKKEIKSLVKAKKSMSVQATSSTQGMDQDLKYALIFLIVGAVGYWILWPIGAILTIVGLYFLIKWLLKQ